MNLLLKNLSVIFLLLFIVASKGVAQEIASDDSNQSFLQAVQNGDIEHVIYLLESEVGVTDELVRSAAMSAAYSGRGDILKLLMEEVDMVEKASHICPDYIFNIRVEDFDQTPGRGVTFNNDSLRGAFELGGDATRLELSFLLQRYNNSTPSLDPVRGIGTSISFQIGRESIITDPESNNDDLSRGVEISSFVAIADAVKEAVKNGYEQLRNEYERKRQQGFLQQQLITSTVIEWWDNKIQIPLGRSHYIQEGDIFNIYGTRVRNYRNRCSIARLSTPLTTATVVEIIDENNAILEINENSGVQFGDIVTLSVDLESRTIPRRILKLESISSASIEFRSSDGTLTEDITSYIRYFLVTEAADGFQVIEE